MTRIQSFLPIVDLKAVCRKVSIAMFILCLIDEIYAAIMEFMMHLKVLNRCAALLRNRSGNVAIITAFSAIPMIGMMGLAVDYATALSTKSKLDAAADAAAIAAVTAAQNVVLTSNGAASASGAAATSAAQTAGSAAFRANAGSLSFNDPVPVPNIVYGPDPNNPTTLNANVTYSTAATNHFGQIFNVPTTTVSGQASSSLTLATYKNIYMVLDNSQSMGIGTTQSDMTKLIQLTSQAFGPHYGCYFGCHAPSPVGGNLQPGPFYNVSNETIAESGGVVLRIDTLRNAVQQVISTVKSQSPASGPAPTQIALYTLNNTLTPLQTVTSDFSALATAASKQNLDLDNSTTISGIGDTNLDNGLRSLAPIVQFGGNGQVQSSPQKYVILVTDGLNDFYGPFCTYQHCTSLINLANCTALKNSGITLGIIYTTYLPAPTEVNYIALVQNIQDPPQDLIGTQLKQCVSSPSSSWFNQASDGPDIQAAIQNMIGNITQQARLTN